MRILFLTFYFQPDLSAGSFRATALANALVAQGDGKVEVDVLTTHPNRYHSFSVNAAEQEVLGNLRIRRFQVPVHKSGMVDQSRAFASYARQVIGALRGRSYDLVFATSSRLMTAALGALVSKRLSAPLYLDIRDIFTDTMQELLAGRPLRHLIPILKAVERFTLRSAAKINLVSGGFEDYARSIVPDQHFSVFTNGIDEDFLGVSFVNPVPNPRPVILYAGNIGEGQGLHRVLPEAARRLEGEAEFWIVGDGGARKALESALARAGVGNVRLEYPVTRAKLLALYREADCLFLHLNCHEAFLKVLPSKVFEYAATGKPILAGVSGYAREFIKTNLVNVVVFDPCNPEGLIEGFRSLRLELTPRDDFVRRFSRANIAVAMAKDILSLLPGVAGKGRQKRDMLTGKSGPY